MYLDTFYIIWKLSSSSGHFLDHLDTFQIIWTLFRSSGNFPVQPDTLHITWIILCEASGHFPSYPEIFQPMLNLSQKLSGFAKTFRVAMLPCYPGFWASARSTQFGQVVQLFNCQKRRFMRHSQGELCMTSYCRTIGTSNVAVLGWTSWQQLMISHISETASPALLVRKFPLWYYSYFPIHGRFAEMLDEGRVT